MKRFVIATASALFLLAGTAAASVPYGPASRSAHDSAFSASTVGGPGVTPAAPVGLAPLAPGVDPAVLADPDLAIPGLPGGVTQLFGAVDPALAALAGVVPPPVAGVLPPVVAAPAPVPPPVPVPGVTPAPAPPAKAKPAPPIRQHASANRVSPRALQAAAAAALFQGLPSTGYAGYGTASVIHLDALQAGMQRLANVDAAFSGATFTSASLAQPTTNEMARIVAPALAAGNAFGRGSGLEVGVAIDQSGQNQVIPGSVAEAKAPPSTSLVTTQVGPVNVDVCSDCYRDAVDDGIIEPNA